MKYCNAMLNNPADCEIFCLVTKCEMKFATFAIANISHLRSKYFTAKLFHLPIRANFVAPMKKALAFRKCFFLGTEGETRKALPCVRYANNRLCSASPSGVRVSLREAKK